MDQEKNTVFELLRNEHFVRWVQNPTDASDRYWFQRISSHEQAARNIEIASRIIQSGSLAHNRPVSEEQYAKMLGNIMDHARLHQPTSNPSRTAFWKYTVVAASVMLAILSILFLIDYTSTTPESSTGNLVVKEAPPGSKLTTRLPDGSTITLNSGSTVSFPEAFLGNSRTVQLSGEAFFDVEHNPAKPFYVQFRDQEVKVLGTSFSVRCYDAESYTQVAVATGKVAYAHNLSDEIILLPNEKASLAIGSSQFKREKVNALADFGWRDRILYFESSTFEEIKTELQRWYGVSIQNSDLNPSGTYSGKFQDASLKEVLTGLSFIYRFDFTIEKDQVILTTQQPLN
ncbi:MAG: FecR domain-containing protein [Cyclobacteriaceae bacterium]